MISNQRLGNQPKPERNSPRALSDVYPDYQHPEGMGELVTQADIGRHLGVRGSAVANWINRGHLPTPKVISGRHGLWDKQEVTDWHNSRSRKGQIPPPVDQP